jgi:uncharacterized repeat protein (TIGR01451 family)
LQSKEKAMSHIRGLAVSFNALLLAALPVALTGAPVGATPPPAGLSFREASLSAAAWNSIQVQMRQASYHFTRQTVDSHAVYRAPNLAHDLELSLGANGLRATQRAVDGQVGWEFGLRLAAYGTQRLPGGAEVSGRRERAEARYDQGVTEWVVNGEAGVEHGLTLSAPPPGGQGTLAFDLRGSLVPSLDAAGQSLHLRDAAGQTVLVYDRLAVYDAAQRRLAADFGLRGGQLLIHFDAAAAVYPVVVDPLLHRQVAKLTASDAAENSYFGWSVAISGDTLVVGAIYKASQAGAAYVFERNQGGADAWGRVTKLTASDGAPSSDFGYSVALSDDTLVVGAYNADDAGAAYVFERNRNGADAWGEVAKLTASDGAALDEFGGSVALSGDTLVVGAPEKASWAGAAYVFARNQDGADAWGEVKKLTSSDGATDDCFGGSVALSGDTLVAGAWDNEHAGAAYVFARNQNGTDAWGEVTKLTASDGATGDHFGYSVALSHDTLVVGAHRKASGAGAAYVFYLEAPTDLQVAKQVQPASAAPGQAITYTLTYSNAGPSTAAGVVISDTLPLSVTGVSVISGGAVITPLGGTRYAWSVADLAPGAGGIITLTGVLSQPLAAQVIANTATITATTPDTDTTNNSAMAVVQVISQADLQISKQAQPASAVPGRDTIAYTVVVTNAGPSAVGGATLTDILPAELDNPTWTCAGSACPSSSGSGSLSQALDLAAGDVVTYRISGTLKASAASLSNTASITATAADPDPSNNSATAVTPLTPQADLAIAKSAQSSGAAITYTITLRNLGPSDAGGALVTDTFPTGVGGVMWSCAGENGATCGAASGAGDIAEPVDTLPPGGQVTYTATGTLNVIGPVVNQAGVAPPAGVTDPVAGNNQATAQTESEVFLPVILRR